MSNEASAEYQRLMHEEMQDNLDEEIEMELDDDRLENLLLDSESSEPQTRGLDRHTYFRELLRLQGELVNLQDWVVHKNLKVVVLFEGRDAAGKGGVIKRVNQRLNPRVCRVVALPAPNAREQSQWYFQRCISHLPGGGEIVLFDRSWYNRAGVEKVMGFCSDDEQYRRFLARVHDPLKQWKLSPMDMESRRRWEQYTKAKEVMIARTHIPEAPWWNVEAVDKKRARLNCIHHLLSKIPYQDIEQEPVELPEREFDPNYSRAPLAAELYVPSVY